MLKDIPLQDKKVLDLGCGIGDFSFFLSDQGAKVTGIDIESAKINTAKEVAQKLQKKITFLCNDASSLEKIGESSFDLVICLAVIEHIDDDEGLLYAINRIMKTDGYLILNTITDLRKYVPEKEREAGHFHHGYPEQILRKMLETSGFQIMERIYYDPSNLFYYFNRITYSFPKGAPRTIMGALIFPVFRLLIPVTSWFVRTRGHEFTFKCIKKK